MGHQPFETILEAHHGEIYRYLLRLTARRNDAEDLSQETFLRAYRAYRALAPDANVRAWLFTIATNLTRNHYRGETRRRNAHAAARVRAESNGWGADAVTPEGETLFKEARALLDRMVAGLPLKQRAAFVLRKIHDLDYDAIARSLDCSAESARAHVFQALRKIRQGLQGRELAAMESER
jgi:RNA polymerase sigma-70 factor (ECF subfamily)